MGFFDFLFKNRDEKLKEYLKQLPSWVLVRAAEKMMWVSVFVSDAGRPWHIQKWGKMSSVMYELEMACEEDKTELIPRSYRKEEVSMVTLLEVAQEQGNARAAFYLFMIYDNGLDNLFTSGSYSPASRRKLRDEQKAAYYREMARQGNDVMEKAYTYAEELAQHNAGVPIKKEELIFLKMRSCEGQIGEILEGQATKDDFERLGMFALSGLAQMGYPYAMAVLINDLHARMYTKKEHQTQAWKMLYASEDTSYKEAILWGIRALEQERSFDREAAYAYDKFRYSFETMRR